MARAHGIATGGWLPLGFLTETPDGKGFGDTTTPGARATLDACRQLGKTVCQVWPGGPARPSHVAGWVETHRVRVLNVAGNRASTAPDVGPRVGRFLGEVRRRLGHARV